MCVYALYIQYIPLYSRFLGQLCHHMFLLCVLMAFAQEGSWTAPGSSELVSRLVVPGHGVPWGSHGLGRGRHLRFFEQETQILKDYEKEVW